MPANATTNAGEYQEENGGLHQMGPRREPPERSESGARSPMRDSALELPGYLFHMALGNANQRCEQRSLPTRIENNPGWHIDYFLAIICYLKVICAN
jgi:hypothetical protein